MATSSDHWSIPVDKEQEILLTIEYKIAGFAGYREEKCFDFCVLAGYALSQGFHVAIDCNGNDEDQCRNTSRFTCAILN